jgi:mannose-1-phosphate guanylyltransferase
MTADFEQITSIIKNNPSKGLINDARATADKLMMHVFGRNLQNSITNYGYFENNDVYKDK